MPTVDAAQFRETVLKMPTDQAYALSHRAWQNLEPITSHVSSKLKAFYAGFPEQSIYAIIRAAEALPQQFAPLRFDRGSGNPSVTEFYKWAEQIFPTENYGYHSVWDKFLLTDEETKVDVLPPKTASLDGTAGQFHECFHTACAAKGYFSQLGIPTEVVSFTLPSGVIHGAAVTFTRDTSNILTTLIDASPFSQGFSEGEMADYIPLSWSCIKSNENKVHCFAEKIYTDGISVNCLPWFSRNIFPDVILAAFAHVSIRYDRPSEQRTPLKNAKRLMPQMDIMLIFPSIKHLNLFELPILIGDKKDGVSFLWQDKEDLFDASMIDAIEKASLEPATHFIQMLRKFKVIR